MNRTVLAEYLVSRQPAIIRRRLDRRAGFGARLGFRTRTLVTVGSVGRFDEETLLSCARQVCSDGVERPVLGIDGAEAILARDAEGLALRSSRADAEPMVGRVDELLVLSGDVCERRAAVTRLLGLIGPTGGEFAGLAGVAAERELSTTETAGLLHELWGGVMARQARAADTLAGSGSVEDLVPSSLGYYERFCGPAPDGSDAEEYLKSVLPEYRRQLLGRNLTQGLAIALVGNLHDDVSPARWLEGVSDDQLWEALTACEPRRDPFSLLGALDVALGRRHDRRYLAFAEEALHLLAADELQRPDGTDAYALMALFVRLASARLVLAEGGACRPPIWRRLCAWMQAGLLGRLCWTGEVDPEAVRSSATRAETLAVVYGRTLDLHRVPMYAAGEVGAHRLRAEVLGRLVLLCRRHEAAGHEVAGVEAVARACERLNEQRPPLAWELPGPLEGHAQPTRALPPEAADVLASRLADSPGTGAWTQLAHLSQLCGLGEDLRERMRGFLREVRTAAGTEKRHEVFQVLYQACRVAAAHRDEGVADAAAATLQQQASTADGEDVAGMLDLLLLAGAAFADEGRRSAWLRDRLAELAALLPAAAAARLRECLEELRHAAPVNAAVWARAEFISAAT